MAADSDIKPLDRVKRRYLLPDEPAVKPFAAAIPVPTRGGDFEGRNTLKIAVSYKPLKFGGNAMYLT